MIQAENTLLVIFVLVMVSGVGFSLYLALKVIKKYNNDYMESKYGELLKNIPDDIQNNEKYKLVPSQTVNRRSLFLLTLKGIVLIGSICILFILFFKGMGVETNMYKEIFGTEYYEIGNTIFNYILFIYATYILVPLFITTLDYVIEHSLMFLYLKNQNRYVVCLKDGYLIER